MRRATIILALASTLVATAAIPAPRPGQVFQIATDREMEEHGNRDESGRSTSTDRDSYVERVVTVRSDGVVLDYDLPANATSDERASGWQFPFQVLKAPDGTIRLLNEPELANRIDRWLKAAGMQRAACGKLIFTWNAFRIECDPQSTIKWLATVTLPDRLEAGSTFTDPDAQAPTTLRQGAANKLVATLSVDPATVLRQRAQTDVGIAEIMHKTLTPDAAIKAHAAEKVTGTITVTFDLDAAGRTRRRTRVRMVQVAWPNGRIDTQTVTETVAHTPL
ncbi:MAG: hypothetical protein EOO77_24345 [Oxalobacteraceae bacterium]|nr:MAG: hypothetical protein EOO77_24345 [Oxalobacteraceae bacterium]